jgi:hypothetical protein
MGRIAPAQEVISLDSRALAADGSLLAWITRHAEAPSHASESCALAHWAGTASRLAVFAANRALTLVFQGAGSARKKSESTSRRHPASLSRSHSRRSAQSVSWTSFSSVCFAQLC